MGRYYLHVFNDVITRDDEGMELADADAALAEARYIVGELAAESVRTEGHLVLSHKVVVEDAAGSEIGTVYFRDVISVHP
jgi:hypothetical protein